MKGRKNQRHLVGWQRNRKVHCVIEPMYCECFEIFCENHDVNYEFIVNDTEGMRVWMMLSDYIAWYTDSDEGGGN